MTTAARLLLVWCVIFAAGFVGLGLYDALRTEYGYKRVPGEPKNPSQSSGIIRPPSHYYPKEKYERSFKYKASEHKTAYLVLGGGTFFLLVNGFVVRGRTHAGPAEDKPETPST